MSEWKHTTIFDREYPADKQAEAIAIQEAVVEGHCDKCGFLLKCSTDCSFYPPVFAWCFRRKNEILKSWGVNIDGGKDNGNL